MAQLRSAPSADLRQAQLVHERRYVQWNWEVDGSLRLRGSLPPADGAALIEAVETASSAMHGGGGSRDRDTWLPKGARRADALTEVAMSGAPRAQVVLHVDTPALRCTAEDEKREGETCAIAHGPAVPSDTARRLSCDADLVLEPRGGCGSVDLGRSARVVNPPLRGALEHRDEHCRVPGCERRHGLHAHHLTHWIHGGGTDRDNLVLLCRLHHWMAHEGGFTIARRGDEFVGGGQTGEPSRRCLKQRRASRLSRRSSPAAPLNERVISTTCPTIPTKNSGAVSPRGWSVMSAIQNPTQATSDTEIATRFQPRSRSSRCTVDPLPARRRFEARAGVG